MEEKLLEFEESTFPMLQHMFQFKQPYESLWNTALQWTNKFEAWMNGINYIKTSIGSYNMTNDEMNQS